MTTAWKVITPLGGNPVDQILILAATPKAATAVAREVTNTLLQQHNIVDPALADFTVLRQAQLIVGQVQTAQAVRRVLEISAALFLLTGAIYLRGVTRRHEAVPSTGRGEPRQNRRDPSSWRDRCRARCRSRHCIRPRPAPSFGLYAVGPHDYLWSPHGRRPWHRGRSNLPSPGRPISIRNPGRLATLSPELSDGLVVPSSR